MEKYCITLEQARKLGELGMVGLFGKAEYCWQSDPWGRDMMRFDLTCEAPGMLYPAYHLGELLDILPNEIDDGSSCYFLTKQGQIRGYEDVRGKWLVKIQGTKPEAEAFGEILIWLVENGFREVFFRKGVTN